jgi:hypothetical protein
MIAALLLLVQTAEPSAADIMAKVAENQDRAQQARSEFVYQQNLLVRFRRGNSKLAREERREYAVTPTPSGLEKTLIRFSGKYERDGKLIEYDKPHYKYKDTDIDGDVISDLADDMTNDNGSRDGMAADLFPLTGREQKKYTFRLKGTESYRGRGVYRVEFSPARDREDGSCWAGEVLVDKREYQPVAVSTRLAKGIPFWVKTVLGTNLKYLGFSLAYERFDDGIWFPVSYGGEFEIRAVFFYKRLISISMANTGFRRASVASRITYAEPK